MVVVVLRAVVVAVFVAVAWLVVVVFVVDVWCAGGLALRLSCGGLGVVWVAAVVVLVCVAGLCRG